MTAFRFSRRGFCLVLPLLLWAAVPLSSVAQPDSVRAQILRERGLPPSHTPSKALWRAAALPGWGQVYNRQYLKLPVVYAGLAGIGYAVFWNNDRYLQYRHAHLFRLEQERTPDAPNPYSQFEDEYQDIVSDVGGDLSARQLRQQRDKLRRWRDLSIVGAGLVYVLTIVDAYVSAHLLTFDVGDDLAVNVRPQGPGLPSLATHAAPSPRYLSSPPSSPESSGPGVTLRVRF
jgi:hypothetical protein